MGIFRLFFELLEGIIGGLFEVFFDFIKSLISKQRATEYSAELGKVENQLERSGNGFRIGYKYGNNLIDSHSHLICLGGSGSKKSSCICFPTLLQSHDSSYVVFDCSRELYNGTATHKSNNGYNVKMLNLDDYTNSIGFNGLAKCNSENDVFRLAQVQIKNSLDGSVYDYWAQSAEQMIGLFAYALFLHAEPEFINFANVLNMIQVFSYDAKKIDKWMVATKDDRLINRYKSLVATPEKTLLSTLASATNSLAIYNNPNVAAITSKDTLSFEYFRDRKTILYICGSPSSIQFSKSVCASFFSSFFSHILQTLPSKGALPITFLIDEAATMRLENSLPKILELGRKYSISIATLWQDFNQVEHIFGKNEAANIFANSKLKVFMPSGQPLATCRMLQELLGRHSWTDEKGILKSRELLTAQEIFQLKEILLLNGNNKPLLLATKPFFENKKLRQFTELPIYEILNTVPLSKPTFLNFD